MELWTKIVCFFYIGSVGMMGAIYAFCWNRALWSDIVLGICTIGICLSVTGWVINLINLAYTRGKIDMYDKLVKKK